MKVFLTDRSHAGGIWNVLHPVAEALRDRGDEVVCVRWRDVPEAYADAPEGVRVVQIGVPPRRAARDVLAQMRAFGKAFSRLLAAERPDVVQTNFVLPGAVARVAARRAGVRRVVAVRHETLTCLNRPLRALERATGLLAHARGYVSRHVAATYGCPAAPAFDAPGRGAGGRDVVVHNGVDAGDVPAPGTVAPEPGLIVCAGRLVAVKGQAALVEAFARLAADRPDARLELIGEGPDRDRLTRLAADRGVAGRVSLPGWRDRPALLRTFAAAAAVAVPSDGTQEGFGLTLAEAAACGAPVVCSDIPVFREILDAEPPPGGEPGWFPPGDPAALAEALRAVSDGGPAARAAAERRRDLVLRRFTRERSVAGHLSLIDGAGGPAAGDESAVASRSTAAPEPAGATR